MSESDQIDQEFILDVIKLIVGVLIFIITAFMLQSWDTQREEILGTTTTPGVGLYIAIPIMVGVLTFGATVFIQGVFTVGGVIITRAQAGQTE